MLIENAEQIFSIENAYEGIEWVRNTSKSFPYLLFPLLFLSLSIPFHSIPLLFLPLPVPSLSELLFRSLSLSLPFTFHCPFLPFPSFRFPLLPFLPFPFIELPFVPFSLLFPSLSSLSLALSFGLLTTCFLSSLWIEYKRKRDRCFPIRTPCQSSDSSW